MRSIIIEHFDEKKRIDRLLLKKFDGLHQNTLFKAFRKKNIKINGKWVKEDYIVAQGDVIDIYISDTILDGISDKSSQTPGFDVVFEDYNILILSKYQGIPVHPDRGQDKDTLIQRVHLYLEKKGELNTNDPNVFLPALCHRLDRNTGGLIIVAKSLIALNILLSKFKNGEIKKEYQCLVSGKLQKPAATLVAYLYKNEKISKVRISEKKAAGFLEIITHYKVLEYDPTLNVSKLCVSLITGRTHQIRAHLAFIGHPVIGDGKYGQNTINRMFGLKQQALWANKIHFSFSDQNALSYLDNKSFHISPNLDIRIKHS